MIGEQGGFGLVSLLRGLLGIITILGIAYAMSYDRKRIDWKLVGGGLFMQIVFALAVLYVPFVGSLLEGCGKIFVKLMDFTDAGLTFLLGPYASKAAGFSFLLHSLPIVIFFSALVSMFYHWGIIQKVVGAFAWVLRKFMNISGSEGLVAAGNIFMGMTESPVLIKNYLPTMNRSEIFLVMVSGMGTIAGSVMGTYIGMLGGTDPASKVLFATHLLSASVMAVPGSIVLAKMLCPQTEEATDHVAVTDKEKENSNILEEYFRCHLIRYGYRRKINDEYRCHVIGIHLVSSVSELCYGRRNRALHGIERLDRTDLGRQSKRTDFPVHTGRNHRSFHVVDRCTGPGYHAGRIFTGTKDHIERICRLFPIAAMERCRIIHV